MTETITCTRRIQFCAGHRVYKHESKCANMHGHNYVAYFTAHAELDSIGRVIDFSVLKARIGGWIDEYWDHGFILWRDDDVVKRALEVMDPPQKMYKLRDNPTAENMAKYLLEVICPSLLTGTGVVVTEITLYETENCYATAKL